jgi:hypothetical protein
VVGDHPAFFQDGRVAATIFDLVTLALVGQRAERVFATGAGWSCSSAAGSSATS